MGSKGGAALMSQIDWFKFQGAVLAARVQTWMTWGLLGVLTTWNAVFFAAARVRYAFGRAGVIHSWFGRAHAKYGTPANAIVFVGVAGLTGTFAGRGAVLPIASALSTATTAVRPGQASPASRASGS